MKLSNLSASAIVIRLSFFKLVIIFAPIGYPEIKPKIMAMLEHEGTLNSLGIINNIIFIINNLNYFFSIFLSYMNKIAIIK